MGLDVVAYGDMVEVEKEAWADIPESELFEVAYNRDWCIVYEGFGFPGSLYPIKEGVPYTAEDTFDFRAGSYGGYANFRDWLAEMAGYDSAEAVWEACSTGPFYGPFVELINFSDCEGVLGTAIAAKLFKDFQDHATQAEDWAYATLAAGDDKENADFFTEKYEEWRKAFEIASNYGCVVFC